MLTNQNFLWVGTLLVFIALGSIIVFFIYSLIKHQKNFIKLQKERMRAEVESLEKERKRVAADLHDSLGPYLSAIKFQINSMDTNLEHDLVIIAKASHHIDCMVTDIRRIANNLNPNVLYDKGLDAAIVQFIKTIQSVSPVKINYHFDATANITFSEEASIHIYRIIQEVINNAIKHSEASVILIKILKKNKKCLVVIQDNGKGFNVAQNGNQSIGLGLKNLATRTELLNGTLEIDSMIGKGTITTFGFDVNKISKKIQHD